MRIQNPVKYLRRTALLLANYFRKTPGMINPSLSKEEVKEPFILSIVQSLKLFICCKPNDVWQAK